MAMIDYGAVVFKNGEQVNHELFMDMLDAVGWVDCPRRRYPDCDHVDEKGFSQCHDCSRAMKKAYHNDEFGNWESPYADCKGNQWSDTSKIDGSFFVYVGDEHLTVAAYKNGAIVIVDKKIVHEFWESENYTSNFNFASLWNHLSSYAEVDKVKFHLKAVDPGHVQWLRFTYNGNHYDIVYGYGIDPDMKVWDDVKNCYLGKSGARKVDNLYRRIRKSRKFYH